MTSAIALSADLLQRRDDMRTLLGPHYETDVETFRLALRKCAACWGTSLADTALRIAEDMQAADESEAGE